MKNDLISRQTAINAMTDAIWHFPNECYKNLNSFELAKELAELGLRSVPSAEPEIIRCKECQYYEGDIMGNPYGVCCHPDWVFENCGHEVDEDGWCYRAESYVPQ